jgi:hypothetical protein
LINGEILHEASEIWDGKGELFIFSPKLPDWLPADNVPGIKKYTYADFPADEPLVVEFQYLKDAGGIHKRYLFGYDDGSVRPHDDITRAEAAVFMARLNSADLPSGSGGLEFSDIRGHWAHNEIRVMSRLGLMIGYPDGTFKPDAPITCEELIKVLVIFANMQKPGAKSLGTGGWSAQYIDNAAENGYITGDGDIIGNLQENMTRGQVVTVFNRIMNRHFDVGLIDGIEQPFNDVLLTGEWPYADIIEASVDHAYTRDEQGREQSALINAGP